MFMKQSVFFLMAFVMNAGLSVNSQAEEVQSDPSAQEIRKRMETVSESVEREKKKVSDSNWHWQLQKDDRPLEQQEKENSFKQVQNQLNTRPR